MKLALSLFALVGFAACVLVAALFALPVVMIASAPIVAALGVSVAAAVNAQCIAALIAGAAIVHASRNL